MINFKEFFDHIRINIFNNTLTQGVVDTSNVIIFDFINLNGLKDKVDVWKLSYVLATAYHESYHPSKNKEWNPCREGYASTNQGAINAVTKLFNNKRIKTNYALPEPNGKSYYGRGFIQITWADNYKKVGKLLNLDLYNNPDLALVKNNASKILVEGMLNGWFRSNRTTKKLESLSIYFNDSKKDYLNARNIVNGGLDAAERIKNTAEKFEIALINSFAKNISC